MAAAAAANLGGRPGVRVVVVIDDPGTGKSSLVPISVAHYSPIPPPLHLSREALARVTAMDGIDAELAIDSSDPNRFAGYDTSAPPSPSFLPSPPRDNAPTRRIHRAPPGTCNSSDASCCSSVPPPGRVVLVLLQDSLVSLLHCPPTRLLLHRGPHRRAAGAGGVRDLRRGGCWRRRVRLYPPSLRPLGRHTQFQPRPRRLPRRSQARTSASSNPPPALYSCQYM